MLGLPRSTEVNRRIAKEKFYVNAMLTAQLRETIKGQIETIVWRNKLADTTMGISAGSAVKELQVFEIQLRERDFDRRILPAIVKAIPYKILFLLVFESEVQAWIEVSGTFYNTDWEPLDAFALKFEGLNLDAVYENLARQLSGGRLGTDGDIDEAVDRDKQRKKLEQEIAILEKKMLREPQFNRQVEINGEIRRLRAALEEISDVR